MNENGIHSLIIKACTADDAGQYMGAAENKAGRAEFNLQLNVLEKEYHVPPKFTERIRGVDVASGQDIVLTCVCVGNPLPNLAWTKDNKYIKNDEKHRYYHYCIVLYHFILW